MSAKGIIKTNGAIVGVGSSVFGSNMELVAGVIVIPKGMVVCKDTYVNALDGVFLLGPREIHTIDNCIGEDTTVYHTASGAFCDHWQEVVTKYDMPPYLFCGCENT